MNSEGQGTLTVAALRQTRAQRQAVRRRVLPIALVAILIGAARSTPRPGLAGIHLGVLVAMAGLAVVAAGGVLARDSRRLQEVLFAVLLACSALLVWLQPGGPGTIGLFVAVGFGAQLMNGRWGMILAVAAGLSIIALIVLEGAGAYTGHPALGVPGVVAVAALLLTVVFRRRVQMQDEQADQMLLELEQTRGAELRAAALAERQRLAREMHDVLAHSLSGLVMQLEGARLLAASDPGDPRLADTIVRAHHLARSGLNEARRAINMLHDDELPGPESIETMTTEFTRDSGIPCRFVITGSCRDVGSETQLALYRVAQEALTNIRKHAHPDRAVVTLAYQPQAVSLTVEDVEADPAPGDPPVTGAAPPSDGGYGLTGMRERAELLGGTLIASPTGHGFRVELQVPR